MSIVSHMRTRRRALQSELRVWQEFKLWEETCIPSYCHPNWLAAYVSWSRLFASVALARQAGASGPVLDFGSSTGELGRLLPADWEYHFIEQEAAPAGYLQKTLPAARRQTLDEAPSGHYGCVFALDSLEHNEDFPQLIERLAAKLAPGGRFVLSGPTENLFYRLGRRIAGFDAHYHVSNIDRIEAAMERTLSVRARQRLPWAVPLFKLSVWSKRD
jgi:SAM-dependent methyltransferase